METRAIKLYDILKQLVLRSLSLKKQFLIINVLYQRAKYHKNQTKNMIQSITVFEKWLKKYKTMKGGSIINKDLPYLDLSLVN